MSLADREDDPTDLRRRLDAALGDRYRIERELGRGGEAIVYLAEDRKHRRHVAVKLLRADGTSPVAGARFLREIEIIARLSHPNILGIHDSGVGERVMFYVMPFVEGESLRDRLRRERQLSVEEAVRIGRELADALHYAHAQGILHRDIKPENILLQSGHAVISDFGIAQRLGDVGEERLTETGLAIGTIVYMSPEQANAEQALDARSDIHSLGCVVYEMLAGEPPHDGRTSQAVIARKMLAKPPRLRDVRPTVPAALEQVIATALSPVPADRYATAAQFSDALGRATMGKDVGFDPGSGRRRMLILSSLVIAAAAVGLGGLAVSDGGLGAPRMRSIAVLPFDDISADSIREYFAAGMHDAVIAELSQIGSLRVISRRSALRYRGSGKTIPEIARELGVDGVVEGTVRRTGDSVRVQVALIEARPQERSLWNHGYERHISESPQMHGDVARGIADEIRVRLTPDERQRLMSAARVDPATYEAYLEGMFYIDKPGAGNVQRGIALLQRAVDRSPGDAHAWVGLGAGYARLGHGPRSMADAWPRARAAAMRAVTLDSLLAEAHAVLAETKLYHDWDWDGAERGFRRAIELNPNLAMAHYHYAWYLVLRGRLDDGIEEHKRAQTLDPLTPLHTAWLGSLYTYAERYADGVAEARKALELNPDFPPSLFVLGQNYAMQGMFAEAIAAHEKLAVTEPAWKAALGVTYVLAGRNGDARRVLVEVEAEPRTAWLAYNLAYLYSVLGEMDRAIEALAYTPPHAFLPWVAVDPMAATMRRDPRFSVLLRRLKLPELQG